MWSNGPHIQVMFCEKFVAATATLFEAEVLPFKANSGWRRASVTVVLALWAIASHGMYESLIYIYNLI